MNIDIFSYYIAYFACNSLHTPTTLIVIINNHSSIFSNLSDVINKEIHLVFVYKTRKGCHINRHHTFKLIRINGIFEISSITCLAFFKVPS